MKRHSVFHAFLIFSVFFTVLTLCGCQINGAFPTNNDLQIVVITDTHFAGKENHLYEGTYLESNDSNGSGKQMRYLDDIFDAFVDQMIDEKPDYIVITGDLTYIGAKASHIEFAKKLSVLKDAGINVLVSPGNHDIVSYAFIFPDGEPIEADPVSADDFADIYSDFGYSGAISYDSSSLSYVYDTGKGCRIFMLDTNFIYGSIFGQLSSETLEWLEEQLVSCTAAGDMPLVTGHHNLLVHNKYFTLGYTIGNSAKLKELLEKYNAELYLSGHIHTQHISTEGSITDIVTEAFSVYPHRYGAISFSDGRWSYESKITNVAEYAKKAGFSDENLLDYENYGKSFFYNNAYNQAMESLSSLVSDTEKLDAFCKLSAEANVCYFGGCISVVDTSLLEEFYEVSSGTRWGEYINYILQDKSDQLIWSNYAQ